MTWRSKLFLLLFLFALVPMAALTFLSLAGLEKTSRETTLDGLEALARAKAEALDQFSTYRERDVERIANLLSPYLVRLQEAKKEARMPPEPETESLPKLADAEKIAAAPEGEKVAETPDLETREEKEKERAEEAPEVRKARDDLARTLGFVLWDQQDFEELLLINASGRVVASTFSEHEGRSATDLDYFQGGRKATFVQPVFLSPITEKLTMVIATPIMDDDHQLIGVVAARLNLKRFFRLINDNTGLGESGETLVIKRINDELSFMAPTRHDIDAALTRQVAVRESSALTAAVGGDTGQGGYYDYRGKETLAAWTHVPSLEWGLVVKIDSSEALENVAVARERMLYLAVLIVLAVLLASMAASRALVRPLRQLKAATDRISRGDLAVELDIRSKDEIGALSDSFERMVAAIKFFREHSRPADEDPPDDEDPGGAGEIEEGDNAKGERYDAAPL